MRVAMPTETKPTAREMRDPKSSLEKTSRPIWSVPNQCLPEGDSRILFISGLFGSHGANTGARMATTTSTPTTTAPTQASWLRRNVRQN
jgi:hypothetical protein